MKESIQKIDLNFTNGGGGHTASVSSILNAKSLDGSEGLGIVVGELGEINSFSNNKISNIMSNFVCTSHSVGADPTKKVVSRKYTDRTTLKLNSFAVLVRGRDCGPETLEYEGPLPYFSEVLGSPLRPFKPKPPVVDRENSVIMIGKIYNYEAAATFNGIKITLVYQEHKLKTKLSLNDELVSAKYKGIATDDGGFFGGPDLAKYDLKFGYTINELKEALRRVGLTVSGLPDNDEILFENGGTLNGVLGTVASYLGYFWFVDPSTGNIMFINTAQASSFPITDYTKTTDENIINASFTRSTSPTKLVNVYTGTAEKQENQANDDGNSRTRKMVFKRVFLENIAEAVIDKRIIEMYFAIFNQNKPDRVFDKFTYALLNMNMARPNGVIPFKRRLKQDKALNFGKYYEDKLETHKLDWYFNPDDKENNSIAVNKGEAQKKANRDTKLVNLDRYTDKFRYIPLRKKDFNNSVTEPSNSELYSFLDLFYQYAGGFFISNGYTEYKVDRCSFSNNTKVSVLGPYHKKTRLDEIEELGDLVDWFTSLDIPIPTVGKMAEATNGKAKTVFPFHFIGIRQMKKREKFKDDDAVDFDPLDKQTEIHKFNQFGYNYSHMGGPAKFFNGGKFIRVLFDIIQKSKENYENSIEEKSRIRLPYVRTQTRTQDDDPDGEEAEDDAIAESPSGAQQESDLFDRFDLRSFEVNGPTHDILNKITLSKYNGSVTEMNALKKARVNYDKAAEQPKSSSRTVYGLEIPDLNATTNSISISVGSNGIQTTINESTIKLIPPDQKFLSNQGMDVSDKSNIPNLFTAAQRNFFGL
jgi:hypothetical protein